MLGITRREVVLIFVSELFIGIPLGAVGTFAFNEVVENSLVRDIAVIALWFSLLALGFVVVTKPWAWRTVAKAASDVNGDTEPPQAPEKESLSPLERARELKRQEQDLFDHRDALELAKIDWHELQSEDPLGAHRGIQELSDQQTDIDKDLHALAEVMEQTGVKAASPTHAQRLRDAISERDALQGEVNELNTREKQRIAQETAAIPQMFRVEKARLQHAQIEKNTPYVQVWLWTRYSGLHRLVICESIEGRIFFEDRRLLDQPILISQPFAGTPREFPAAIQRGSDPTLILRQHLQDSEKDAFRKSVAAGAEVEVRIADLKISVRGIDEQGATIYQGVLALPEYVSDTEIDWKPIG